MLFDVTQDLVIRVFIYLYINQKAELTIFPLMYGLDNICKSGIWGGQKNLNIEENHL